MKNIKIFTFLLSAINLITENTVAFLFNTIFAVLFSALIGINPFVPIIVWNILALRFTDKPAHNTMLRVGVQKEIWLPFIMENFYKTQAWLTKGRDMSALVENNTLNLAEAGILPEVYVNNTTFPMTIAQRTDIPISITLDTLSTQPTVVRAVEAMESSYPKMVSVMTGHKDALRLMSYKRAAHAYTPNSNTANTPVIVATGADDGTGRKRLTLDDLAKAQTKVEQIDGIDPDITKTLVLCSLHKEDLILEDKDLFKAFANLTKGQVLPLFNFDVYVYNGQAVFNTATGVKKPFGTAAAGTDSKAASFFFVDTEVMYADGTYDMFAQYQSPTEQGDIISFLKRFIALPIRNKGNGAIYSPAA